jgi:hypothetical protein
MTAHSLPPPNLDPDAPRFPTPQPGEPHIAVWGTPASGKTTYLASLRFQVHHPDSALSWNLLPDPRSAEWFEVVFNKMAQGQFPDATPLGRIHYVHFDVRDRQTRALRLKCTFVDASGELYLDPEGYAQRFQIENPYTYLRQCSGFLMLMDPMRARRGDPNEEFKTIDMALLNLAREPNLLQDGLLKIPIVFVLTKCDEPACRAAFDDAEGFAAEVFGPLVVGEIKARCLNYRWIASTALGFDPGYPSNIFTRYDGVAGIRDPRYIRPVGVAEPIDWLAEELAAAAEAAIDATIDPANDTGTSVIVEAYDDMVADAVDEAFDDAAADADADADADSAAYADDDAFADIYEDDAPGEEADG